MIFTTEEMNQLQTILENESGFDEALMKRCNSLIHMGNFDEAIRSAFVLLEERLRTAVNKDRMTGTQLANYAFNADDGPLANRLGYNKNERDGLRELYSGAFKLYRNRTAHGFIGYDKSEGKSILGLVNLLLILLNRAENLMPAAAFPDYIEHALSIVDEELNSDVTNRLKVFFGKCQQTGLKPVKAKTWIPFRSFALQTRPNWAEAKRHHLAVFYFVVENRKPTLWFPINQYYSTVVGLETEPIRQKVRGLGFFPTGGKLQDYRLELRDKNDESFFNDLYNLVVWIEEKFRATL